MAKTGDDKPKAGSGRGRDSRLAAALRENLRRRKAQARGRDVAADRPEGPPKGGRRG